MGYADKKLKQQQEEATTSGATAAYHADNADYQEAMGNTSRAAHLRTGQAQARQEALAGMRTRVNAARQTKIGKMTGGGAPPAFLNMGQPTGKGQLGTPLGNTAGFKAQQEAAGSAEHPGLAASEELMQQQMANIDEQEQLALGEADRHGRSMQRRAATMNALMGRGVGGSFAQSMMQAGLQGAELRSQARSDALGKTMDAQSQHGRFKAGELSKGYWKDRDLADQADMQPMNPAEAQMFYSQNPQASAAWKAAEAEWRRSTDRPGPNSTSVAEFIRAYMEENNTPPSTEELIEYMNRISG